MGTRPILTSDKSIIFFDSNCLLCSRFIKLILKNDRGALYYSSFESGLADELLPTDLKNQRSTVVFWSKGRLHLKSKAIFAIIKHLRFPWPLLTVFSILPTSLNDFVYNFIAKNRFSWFGRSDNCFLPTADHRANFFD